MPSRIRESVTKYTGVTDPKDVEAIIDVMADRVRIFSDLRPREFRHYAKEAWKMIQYLKTPHGQECWQALCQKYQCPGS